MSTNAMLHFRSVFDQLLVLMLSVSGTHDTWSLSFPFIPLYNINVSVIHVIDLTSSLESLCFIVCRSRTAFAATCWVMIVDHESEIVMVEHRLCWQAIVDRGGGS